MGEPGFPHPEKQGTAAFVEKRELGFSAARVAGAGALITGHLCIAGSVVVGAFFTVLRC
jgi:hypothetical protein